MNTVCVGFYFLTAILLAVFVSLSLAATSGWGDLGLRFPKGKTRRNARLFVFVTVQLGHTRYPTLVGTTGEGINISMMLPLLAHPPLFIPWGHFTRVTHNGRLFKTHQLLLREFGHITIFVPRWRNRLNVILESEVLEKRVGNE